MKKNKWEALKINEDGIKQAKDKIKQILEEIYDKGARDAINKEAYDDAVAEGQAKYKLFGY